MVDFFTIRHPGHLDLVVGSGVGIDRFHLYLGEYVLEVQRHAGGGIIGIVALVASDDHVCLLSDFSRSGHLERRACLSDRCRCIASEVGISDNKIQLDALPQIWSTQTACCPFLTVLSARNVAPFGPLQGGQIKLFRTRLLATKRWALPSDHSSIQIRQPGTAPPSLPRCHPPPASPERWSAVSSSLDSTASSLCVTTCRIVPSACGMIRVSVTRPAWKGSGCSRKAFPSSQMEGPVGEGDGQLVIVAGKGRQCLVPLLPRCCRMAEELCDHSAGKVFEVPSHRR